MSIRIIGGSLKGRRIEVPKTSCRPTSEMLRGALFNICQFALEDAHFLDLFSGSGALGIESLSRQAAFCLFVEKDRKTAALIQKNIKTLDLENRAQIICGDVAGSVKKIRGKFHIVTIDPPYEFSQEHPEQIENIVRELVVLNLLEEGALLFFEEAFSSEHLNTPPQFFSFEHQISRKYGGSLLHQYIFHSGTRYL